MRDDIFPLRLLESERLLWSGRPRQRLILRAWDLLLVPVSIASLVFGIFMVWPMKGYSPASSVLGGAPAMCIAIYLLVGRFFVDPWVVGGFRYAVTDRRILIVRAAPFAKLTALALDRLSEVNLIERAGGLGTIRFGPPPAPRDLSAMMMPALDPFPQFLAIEDARHVFDLIQRTAGKTA